MNICLDTNAYTAFKLNHKVVVNYIKTADRVIIPAIVLGELYAGFYQGSRTQSNIHELNEFLQLSGIKVQEANQEVANHYGLIVKELRKKGKPIPTNDIWIAATCFAAASQLLTRDTHFTEVANLILVPF